MWLFTIKAKTEIVEIFKSLHNILQNKFQTITLFLYTDGGGEFTKLASYLQQNGIQHLVSPPYTPQRIAIVERRHRHIIETAKTILHQASLPPIFWSYACQQATFLINKMPTPILQNKSPHEVLFKAKLNYESIKVFGCLCYPWLRPYTKHKLQPRSFPCVYLGFNTKFYSHQCFDPMSSKLYLSRDVQFIEDNFPFSNIFSTLKTETAHTWHNLEIENLTTQEHQSCTNVNLHHELPPCSTQLPLQSSSSIQHVSVEGSGLNKSGIVPTPSTSNSSNFSTNIISTSSQS